MVAEYSPETHGLPEELRIPELFLLHSGLAGSVRLLFLFPLYFQVAPLKQRTKKRQLLGNASEASIV